MKRRKKLSVLTITAVLCALTLTACGNIDLDDLCGKWTVAAIDDRPPEEYAAEFDSKASKAVTNLEIKEDKKMTVEDVTGSKDYVLEARSNGFVAVDYDTVVQSYHYDEDTGKFYTMVDFGKGAVRVLFKKGTTDLEELREKEKEEAEEKKDEEEKKDKDDKEDKEDSDDKDGEE